MNIAIINARLMSTCPDYMDPSHHFVPLLHHLHPPPDAGANSESSCGPTLTSRPTLTSPLSNSNNSGKSAGKVGVLLLTTHLPHPHPSQTPSSRTRAVILTEVGWRFQCGQNPTRPRIPSMYASAIRVQMRSIQVPGTPAQHRRSKNSHYYVSGTSVTRVKRRTGVEETEAGREMQGADHSRYRGNWLQMVHGALGQEPRTTLALMPETFHASPLPASKNIETADGISLKFKRSS
ncbi:hypothetical protein B0H16DRAFT_1471513 [Mycena metata]|uniref:Uncharacterized protein n=1 Tax=Mycena metata TaxID=1033252 RepID=A0AAD7HS65_9AGAR|nr:hypothetical protein B0H16DRAFT_1471513 [Mycena metata]